MSTEPQPIGAFYNVKSYGYVSQICGFRDTAESKLSSVNITADLPENGNSLIRKRESQKIGTGK
jgi:hypothetical protein